MKISEHWQSEQIGTDDRWGELYVSNVTAGASVVPSVSGNGFYASVPALAEQTNTIVAAIRDAAGNMAYVTKDYWVGTAENTDNTDKEYGYDAAGCLTNLNGTELKWDERYRLKEVQIANGTNLANSVSYEYDVLDRRISRTENDETTYFVYDNNQVVADLDGDGNLLRTYVWGQGIDNLLSFTDHSSNVTYYAIKDHQNTVIAMADASGVVVESYEYDAYGNTTLLDASGNELSESVIGNRYLFQGREYDSATGLYYFRARWYDSETGRWLSKDPIGIRGGLNQYVFCGSNPVMFVDPSGLIGRAAHARQVSEARRAISTDASAQRAAGTGARGFNAVGAGVGAAGTLSGVGTIPSVALGLGMYGVGEVIQSLGDSMVDGDNDNDGIPNTLDPDDDNDGIEDNWDDDPYIHKDYDDPLGEANNDC